MRPTCFALLSCASTLAEYLVYAGYFKADSLPDKYQDPLPKLKASGSLTEGVVDPASIQCKRKQSAHLGALIGWDDTEVATLKRLLASTSAVEDVSNEEIVKAVQDVVEGKGVGPLTGRTSGLTEAQTVEAAWT